MKQPSEGKRIKKMQIIWGKNNVLFLPYKTELLKLILQILSLLLQLLFS